ncbi:MAG: hypothetical protein IJT25_02590 [Clostridia bacterium]|nr:hypothetical protein [Clostridia bacterium]
MAIKSVISYILLLAQSVKEQKLTVLYIGLFAVFVVLLIVDSYGAKKWASGKILPKIFLYFLFIALVAFMVAYFTLL